MGACRGYSSALTVLLALSVSAGLAACTIVKVEGPAKVTRVYPGILRITPTPGAGMVAYRSTGLGLVPGRNGLTLGYADESVVTLATENECRIVLFEPDSKKVAELAALLRGIVPEGQICNTGGTR